MSTEEGDNLVRWFFDGFSTDNLQLVLLGLSTLAFGFHAGVQFVSRQAFRAQQQMSGGLISAGVVETPEWLQTAQYANKVALAVFVLSFLAVLAIEYYDLRRAGKVS